MLDIIKYHTREQLFYVIRSKQLFINEPKQGLNITHIHVLSLSKCVVILGSGTVAYSIIRFPTLTVILFHNLCDFFVINRFKFQN